MTDPNARYGDRRVPTHGAGPYSFDPPTLSPGDSYRLNLREHEENGTKGYYTVISEAGYDTVRITNESDQTLGVTLNENLRYNVPANTVQTLNQEGVYDIEITNNGAADAADVGVSINRSPYGSDREARERRTEPAVKSVIRNFTGL